ncbi:MAG: cobalamin B12-binding domain-containing protein [Candidatus Limnocylindrus sp. ZSMar2m-chloro-G89]|jgi:methylmalonyl-CoA mutase C-terminal domain/subunit|nr:MAG: cobalamin B12-binding domain-containing protein [Candidatus Limnocylindrus sp.]RLT49203.1 MAG: cobalamin B12-binding domain-containing protein [Candidatus Limnocylindrus sp. ZSMar2m-chloro-G89]
MAERTAPIRVLIAKPGLDGHDRGAKVLARGLRDEGFEVIYTGIRRTTEAIIAAAIEEDVDVVGCSILSGAHATLLPKVVAGLRDAGAADVLVVAGGIIPEEDRAGLEAAGIAAIFGPGSTIAEIATYLRAHVRTN